MDGLDVDLVLAGHGRPVRDAPGLVEANRREVHRGVESVRRALDGGPLTAYEIVPKLLGLDDLTPMQLNWGLSMTLSYLRHLELRGEVERRGRPRPRAVGAPLSGAARLGERDARLLLTRAQRLSGAEREARAPVSETVAAVVGVQAQDLHAASLGVRARCAGSTAAQVRDARVRERSVARVWCMRGTLHLVAAQDARWLVELLGPVGLARGRKRRASMGVGTPEAVAAVRRRSPTGRSPATRRPPRCGARASGWPTTRRRRSTSWPPPRSRATSARRERAATSRSTRWPTTGSAPPPGGPTATPRWRSSPAATRPHTRPRAPRISRPGRASGGVTHAGPTRRSPRSWRRSPCSIGAPGCRAGLARRGTSRSPASYRPSTACSSATATARSRCAASTRARYCPAAASCVPPCWSTDWSRAPWRLERGTPRVEPFAKLPRRVAAAVEAEAADVVRHREAAH